MAARDLLFELGTEELPPLALPGLSAALSENIVKGLDKAGIPHGPVHGFATPRRLAVLVEAVAPRQPDRPVERRGPPLAQAFDGNGAPTQAAAAFAKSCAVEVADLERMTTEQGAWLIYRGTQRGAETAAVLGALVNQAVAALPIARRMRWGDRVVEFVRPVHSVVLLFGADVVPCEVLGLAAGRISRGHRFHAPRPVSLRTARSYEGALRRAKVIADFSKRRETIRTGVAAAAVQCGGRALIEPALLDEVTALVEWPVPVAGRFEPRFLELPREVVIATVQDHQRYFPVEMSDGKLACWFVTVSNIESRDPARVRAGNERVVRPRLSDAAFFWAQDLKIPLAEHAAGLAAMTFQARLGSYAAKTLRVKALAESIGARLGAGSLVGRAAELAKADLMTAMVGEFPELQGTMGRHYAEAQGEPPELAAALEEQYRPRFAGDALPATKTGQALALADKLDTLAGIFSIGQKPTGAKDPFALRRAALGVLRILIEGGLDLDLVAMVEAAVAAQPVQHDAAAAEVVAFMTDRLRGLWLERAGTTAEMIEAVLAVQPRSPLDADARLRALREFLALPDSIVLAASNKRIANILRKAGPDAASAVRPDRFTEEAEGRLYAALCAVRPDLSRAMESGRHGDGLRLLTGLRAPIDAFFDEVMVMSDDEALRRNRLAMLRDVHGLLGGVVDLSRLPG